MQNVKPGDVNLTNNRNKDAFRIEVSDETFHFKPQEISDREPTGAQIAEIVGAHPLADYVVLQHLNTGELETLRPTEMTDLVEKGVERFFVIRGSELFRFIVDGLNMEWPLGTILAEHIKLLARANKGAELILETSSGDRVIPNGQVVNLSTGGVERLKTRRKPKTVTVIYNHDQRFEMEARDYTTEELMHRFSVPSGYKLDVVTKEGELRELKPGEKTRMFEGLEFVSHPPRGQSS
jgi:hypothetical protein